MCKKSNRISGLLVCLLRLKVIQPRVYVCVWMCVPFYMFLCVWMYLCVSVCSGDCHCKNSICLPSIPFQYLCCRWNSICIPFTALLTYDWLILGAFTSIYVILVHTRLTIFIVPIGSALAKSFHWIFISFLESSIFVLKSRY